MLKMFVLLFMLVMGVNASAQAQEITADDVQGFATAYEAAFQSCNVDTINTFLDGYTTNDFIYKERQSETESVTRTKLELMQIITELFSAGVTPEKQNLICNTTVRLGQIKPVANGVAFQTLEQSKVGSRYCVSYGVKEADKFKVAKISCTYNLNK